jgi:hypothetical protein
MKGLDTTTHVDGENFSSIQGGLSTAPSGITGFLGTDGILSHDFSDNPDTAASLDAFESSPTARRPGVGRARPCGDRARNVVSGQANQGLGAR